MTIEQTREALERVTPEIEQMLKDEGFITEVIYDEYSIYFNDTITCVSSTILATVEGEEEKMSFSCAVSVFDDADGNPTVYSEEIAQQVRELRENVASFINSIHLDTAATLREAFVRVVEKEREAEIMKIQIANSEKVIDPEFRPLSNKKFYITTAIGAAVIIAVLLIVGGLLA